VVVNYKMRYRLRTLLIVATVGPPVLAFLLFMLWWLPVTTLALGVIVLAGFLTIRGLIRGTLRYEWEDDPTPGPKG
jgi:hypothetical protein